MNPKKLVRKILPKGGVRAAEEAYRKSRVYAVQARYGFPARQLKVIAVTGTNGKTTTCCYINEVLKVGGYKTALFTTAVMELDGQTRPNTSHRTVPLTVDLVRFLRQAKHAAVDYVVLEVTSQALHQHKLIGIPVEVAVMTNLTQDHLDYHGTMERYAAAKARLFNDYLKPRICILNRDDGWFEYFHQQSRGQVLSYGQKPGSEARIQTLKLESGGSRWQLAYQGSSTPFSTQLAGLFNVYNATAAAAVGLVLGLPVNRVATGVEQLAVVPGRMEAIDAGQDFTVLVDYAHTPDALQRVLETAKQVAAGRVLVVFGATGDRDPIKRPLMGEVAARTADLIFLTDDETYSEDGAAIRAVVRQGIETAKGQYQEIADRREAIAAAFQAAQKGDVVVLAGIGHQDSRNMGGVSQPWDERQVAAKLLHNL